MFPFLLGQWLSRSLRGLKFVNYDKRQITAIFGCSMTGDFLPVQLVYLGKTNKMSSVFSVSIRLGT